MIRNGSSKKRKAARKAIKDRSRNVFKCVLLSSKLITVHSYFKANILYWYEQKLYRLWIRKWTRTFIKEITDVSFHNYFIWGRLHPLSRKTWTAGSYNESLRSLLEWKPLIKNFQLLYVETRRRIVNLRLNFSKYMDYSNVLYANRGFAASIVLYTVGLQPSSWQLFLLCRLSTKVNVLSSGVINLESEDYLGSTAALVSLSIKTELISASLNPV